MYYSKLHLNLLYLNNVVAGNQACFRCKSSMDDPQHRHVTHTRGQLRNNAHRLTLGQLKPGVLSYKTLDHRMSIRPTVTSSFITYITSSFTTTNTCFAQQVLEVAEFSEVKHSEVRGGVDHQTMQVQHIGVVKCMQFPRIVNEFVHLHR